MKSRLSKHVLIVDDKPAEAMVLVESLEWLSKGYIIDTANDASQALKKIAGNNYSLMITDYRLPGMNGLDLAIAVRQMAPDIQIILMTTNGNERLQKTADGIGVSGYLSRPFSMAQIHEIVEHAIEKTERNAGTGHTALKQPVYEQLKELQINTGARCIMLVNATGYPVETSGQTNGIDVTSVGALVAANFMAAAELANKLGSSSVFKSSYHEGQGGTGYNLYAYDVNGDLLLVVVFGVESKTGAVWFYTKQTAANLEALIGKDLVSTTLPISQAGSISSFAQEGDGSEKCQTDASSEESFEQYISEELDNLLKL